LNNFKTGEKTPIRFQIVNLMGVFSTLFLTILLKITKYVSLF
jgi:hypothetical protein